MSDQYSAQFVHSVIELHNSEDAKRLAAELEALKAEIVPRWINTDTVAGLIEWLQQCPPEAKVRIIPARSSGVSDRVSPRLADGAKSKYGYILPTHLYGNSEGAEVEPVVWIR